MATAYSGGNTFVCYKTEASYAATIAGFTGGIQFGRGVKVSNIKRANNVKGVYGLGNRAPQALAFGTFGGTFDVEFAMVNHIEWIQALTGDSSDPFGGSGAIGPTSTLAILLGTDNGTNWGQLSVFLGCVCTGAKFSFNTGDAPVMVTASFAYATEFSPAARAVATYAKAADETKLIFSFGQCVPTVAGVSSPVIEKAEFSISGPSKVVYGLGNRIGVAKADSQLEYTGSMTVLQEDEKWLKYSFDGTTSAEGPAAAAISTATFTVVLTCTNGTEGLTFTWGTPVIQSYGASYTMGDAIMGEVELIGTNLTIDIAP